MISSAALRALRDAGCTADQMIAAVEADELAARIAESDLAMERRERERLKKRRQRDAKRVAETMVASRMSPGTLGDTGDIPSPPPAPSPDKEIPHTPLENNLFPEPPPQPRVSGGRASAFDAFWEKFPNKVGKADARKSFDKALTKIDLPSMLAALDRYVHKTDDRPWCNPATWLNQERWDDRPAAQARGAPGRRMTMAEETGQKLMERMNERYGAGREGGRDLSTSPRLLATPRKA